MRHCWIFFASASRGPSSPWVLLSILELLAGHGQFRLPGEMPDPECHQPHLWPSGKGSTPTK